MEQLQIEYRDRGLPEIEVREHEGEGTKLGGLGIPFGVWSEDLGGFREQVLPGAFKASLETDDIRSLFNHDSNFVLGRKSAGTLRLSEGDRGISYEVDLPDTTWAKDLAESIKRGDIRENSFGMFVTDDIWEEREGLMWRSVRSAVLREVGPQPFPAYTQGDVTVRSLEATLARGRETLTHGHDPDVLERELALDRGRVT